MYLWGGIMTVWVSSWQWLLVCDTPTVSPGQPQAQAGGSSWLRPVLRPVLEPWAAMRPERPVEQSSARVSRVPASLPQCHESVTSAWQWHDTLVCSQSQLLSCESGVSSAWTSEPHGEEGNNSPLVNVDNIDWIKYKQTQGPKSVAWQLQAIRGSSVSAGDGWYPLNINFNAIHGLIWTLTNSLKVISTNIIPTNQGKQGKDISGYIGQP